MKKNWKNQQLCFSTEVQGSLHEEEEKAEAVGAPGTHRAAPAAVAAAVARVRPTVSGPGRARGQLTLLTRGGPSDLIKGSNRPHQGVRQTSSVFQIPEPFAPNFN